MLVRADAPEATRASAHVRPRGASVGTCVWKEIFSYRGFIIKGMCLTATWLCKFPLISNVQFSYLSQPQPNNLFEIKSYILKYFGTFSGKVSC